MSKKFLLVLFLIIFVSIGIVSAQDNSTDEVVSDFDDSAESLNAVDESALSQSDDDELVKVKNNEYISQQIAEKQFNDQYGKKYKDTNPWRVFKDKFIKEWTLRNLKIEYFYDEQLINDGIDF